MKISLRNTVNENDVGAVKAVVLEDSRSQVVVTNDARYETHY